MTPREEVPYFFAGWVTFHVFLSSADFSKLTFSEKSFKITIRVSNGLDLDQDIHSVGPDLGPN